MKVGIVLNRVNFEEKSIITELKKRGHSVEQINNQRLSFDLNNKKINNNIENIDVILNRSLSLSRGLYTAAILESFGHEVVNNYESTRICGDKLLTSLKLIEKGIKTPLTAVSFTKDATIDMIDDFLEYPTVIKPIIGSWGRLIAKLDSKNMASAVLEDREVMGDVFKKIFYLQEYISPEERPKDAPTDIRVLYIDGECVGAMGRYQQGDEFRSNIAIGGKAEKIVVDDEMKKICVDIASAVGGNLLGIDLMARKDGYSCLEVNGTPQFKGLSGATGKNIGEKIVDYLEKKYD
ncbi:MAG: RimK family alpha-L-glutamate ligase [archaeon]|nr:RimK family alpha-L-glutamate ligase [archaeon]